MKETFTNWIDLAGPWILSHGIKIILIGIGAFLLDRIIASIIRKAVVIAVVPDSALSEEAEKKREDTLIRIFTGALNVVILIIAILMILQEAGMEIGPLLAGAGIVGLAFGFGGQYLIKDLIAGLFIILENQYRIGDVININGTGGLVEDISLRMTTIRDMNGTVHHIPHGEITIVSNLSKNFARVNLDIGVAYDSNIDLVIETINRVGNELADDPLFKDNILKTPQFLRINELGDSAIVVKVVGDTKPLKQWEISGELRKRIKLAFDEEGIEIPFPQRVIHQSKK